MGGVGAGQRSYLVWCLYVAVDGRSQAETLTFNTMTIWLYPAWTRWAPPYHSNSCTENRMSEESTERTFPGELPVLIDHASHDWWLTAMWVATSHNTKWHFLLLQETQWERFGGAAVIICGPAVSGYLALWASDWAGSLGRDFKRLIFSYYSSTFPETQLSTQIRPLRSRTERLSFLSVNNDERCRHVT